MANKETQSGAGERERVKSVGTLFSILEHIKAGETVGVSQLARDMDMSKGAIHRYLRTLVDEGYAVSEDGEYRLALRFLDFGAHVRQQYPYNEFVEPKVERLASETGERAQYIVEEHGRGIYLHRKQGENAVETDARVGKVVHLHTTAAGKAILSQLPNERVEAIIEEHGLPERTAQTITEREDLFEELAEIRERGYALNEEEHVRGLIAVGVPITDADGRVLGGLSVSGPANRIRNRIQNEAIQRTLLGIEDEIELNLSYS